MKCLLILALVVVAVSSFPQKRNAGCNSFCPMYMIEFCGSDGNTYNSNPCFIKSQWCNEGRNGFESFSTLHFGACTGDEVLSATTVVAATTEAATTVAAETNA